MTNRKAIVADVVLVAATNDADKENLGYQLIDCYVTVYYASMASITGASAPLALPQ